MPVSFDDSSPLVDLRVLLLFSEELPVDSSVPLASSLRRRDELVDSPDFECPWLDDFGEAVDFASADAGGEDCEFAGGVRFGFGLPEVTGELPIDALGEADVAGEALPFGPAAGGAGLYAEFVAVVAPVVVRAPLVVVAPV